MRKIRMMVWCLCIVTAVMGESGTNMFFDINAFCHLDALTNRNVKTKLSENYSKWLCDFCSTANIREKNLFLEKWLNIAYGAKPVASTNGVGCFTSSYYGLYFDMMNYTMSYMPEATTNEMFKLPMARYIRNIKTLPYKRRTTTTRISGVRIFSTKEEQEKYNLQRLKYYEMQIYDDKMESQNRRLLDFRMSLFRMCSYSMPQLRNSMSCDEFASFTNNFVIESKATEKERKILFERL